MQKRPAGNEDSRKQVRREASAYRVAHGGGDVSEKRISS
jgi:hypothetical protein